MSDMENYKYSVTDITPIKKQVWLIIYSKQ